MYELIAVLYEESKLVDIQCLLVSEGKLQRYQRKIYKNYQKNIFDIWEAYKDGQLQPQELLRRVSQYHHPQIRSADENIEN